VEWISKELVYPAVIAVQQCGIVADIISFVTVDFSFPKAVLPRYLWT